MAWQKRVRQPAQSPARIRAGAHAARWAAGARALICGLAVASTTACSPEARPAPGFTDGQPGAHVARRGEVPDGVDAGAARDGGTVTRDGGFVPPTCGPRALAPRRVSHLEYGFLLADLFDGIALPAIDLATDLTGHGFENAQDALNPSALLVDQYHQAARDIAAAAMSAQNTFAPCAGGADAAVCAADFVRTMGQKVFRRPLSDAEQAAYLGLFTTGPGAESYAAGVQLALQAMLESPAFLYRVETTQPGSNALDAHSVASRLSFLLWSSMPDAALMADADSGALLEDGVLSGHVDRMLADPKARRMVQAFFRQWLDLDRVNYVTKDDARFTGSLQAAMHEETERFLLDYIFEGEHTVADLLTTRQTYVNAELAAFYGVPAPAEGWDEVTLPEGRAGFLTQASFLAGHSHPANPSPVLRGVLVLQQLICFELGTPPPGAESATLPDDVNPQTNRESYALLTSAPNCASCHDVINPVGFALEGFDTTGRSRTHDNGVPVDTSGTFLGTPIDGPADLGAALAALPAAERCLSDKLLEYAYGAKDPGDACIDDAVHTQFTTAETRSVKTLLKTIAQHPEFRLLGPADTAGASENGAGGMP